MVACFAVLILVELLPRRLAVASQPGSGTSGSSSEDAIAARCQKLAREHGLTARELDVLVPLVRGRSAASIASALGMSTETARTHLRHIYQKTGIPSRVRVRERGGTGARCGCAGATRLCGKDARCGCAG